MIEEDRPALSFSWSTRPDSKTLTRNALNANKAHQYALTEYAKKLSAELEELETLLTAADLDDGQEELDTEVQIPGAIKPCGPCHVSEFLNPDSPFYEDASRRTRYLDKTTHHPMKARELEVLSDAVKGENQRLQAYQSQRNGQANDIPIDVENNVEGLDWESIAEKVSLASNINRTAEQCRIKWLGDRHPRTNHRGWSASELEHLKRLVTEQQGANNGKVDWVHVAQMLGTNRTPIDCMRHGIPRQRHTWNMEADDKLHDAVQRYGINNWSLVARVVSEHATAAQCQGRYFRALDPSLKKRNWLKSEFDRLKTAVAAYGNSWMEVAACMPGRTNEQCRERWTEHEGMSTARTKWSEEDDETLLDAVENMGNQWKAISAKVGNGTTGAQCRLRYDKLQRLRATQLALSAASPSGTMSMTPEPRPCAQSTAASVPTGREHSPPPAPKDRPRPRPTYKGKEKQIETLGEENVTDNSPDVIGSQGPEQTVEHSSRRASNKRDREKDGGTETPAAKKKKTTKVLEIVEVGKPVKNPIGRPRKVAWNAKDLQTVALQDQRGHVESPVQERPRPRPILSKEVAAGGSAIEVLAGADGRRPNTISASSATVDQEHTPRRHSARVAARSSGVVDAAS